MHDATHRAQWYPVLGTGLHLQVVGGDPDRVETTVLAAFDEGDATFSVHHPSELTRWRAGTADQPSPGLAAVLAAALEWHERSGGAFHPCATRSGGAVPYRVDEGRIVRTGDTSAVQLDAIAKGWIVDHAVSAALAVDGVRGVTINCGGDLRHAGDGIERVRIEDPRRVVDNAQGLLTVEGSNAALATSANTRRGGHVVDPRTGRPVPATRQVSVLAHDATTADAAATTALVLGPDDATAVLEGVEWLMVEDGRVFSSPNWPV